MLQTEFEFTLPKGYVDKNGDLHRQGVMRLANAKDEIMEMPHLERHRWAKEISNINQEINDAAKGK